MLKKGWLREICTEKVRFLVVEGKLTLQIRRRQRFGMEGKWGEWTRDDEDLNVTDAFNSFLTNNGQPPMNWRGLSSRDKEPND